MTGLRRTGAVSVDVGQGGLLAAQHLVAAGHRRIAILDGVTGARTAMHRAAGYLRGLERGVPPTRASAGRLCRGERPRGRAAPRGLRPRPDAVLRANDLRAYGMMEGLRRAGLKVPEGIAVASFDDIPEAAWIVFDLTTVRLLLRQFCDGLAKMAEASPRPDPLVPRNLVRRGSA